MFPVSSFPIPINPISPSQPFNPQLHSARMNRDATDEELMLAYAAGDAAAFDVLYARHRGPVFRFVRRQVRDDGAAQEIFQDVWMRLIKARARYVPTAKFTTWVFTIAHHRMMDYFRASGQHVEYVAFEPDHGDDAPAIDPPAAASERPDAMLERKRLASRIVAALEELPPAQREAFMLQQEGDLTVEDIAMITGTNRETAKSRLRYALAKLRGDLQDLR
ncbi:MAG: RNA polymerase sigma factor [Burkholderiales bacterium]